MATEGAVHAPKMDAPRAPVAVDGGDAGDVDVDVDAMLAAMRQSAQRLDSMLQRIYAAPSTVEEAESDDDKDTAEMRPVAGLDSVDASLVSCAEYFDAIKAQRDHRVAHRALRGLISDDEVSKVWNADAKTFAAATSDVTYMFPAPPALYVAGGDTEGGDEEQWDMAEKLALDSFQQRVVQCIQRADHAVPPAVVDAVTTLLTRELLAFCAADCELQAIGALFPTSRVTADTVVEWRHGNRICKLQAAEREWRRRWGLEVVLTLETVARAQALAAAGDIATAVLGPPLSCTTTSRVFVPKAQYESLTAAQLTTTSYLCVSVTADTSTTESTKTDEEIETAEEGEATLPEFLDVWHWGGHAVLSPSGEVSTTLPGTFDTTKGFQTLDVRAPFPRNRIVQAACGRLHTLLLSDVGLVFSFGHAMDGALGHGDALRPSEVFVAQPKLVDFFVERATAVKAIACGGDDLTGFHSAAVATDGTVYTWGVGPALGLGSIKSHSTPQRVRVPLQQEQGEGDETATPRVVSIACGSGFCVALASDGSAFAWGKWSDGRLGLGAIPVLTKASRQHGTRRQLQRFQLHPKRLSSESHGAPVRWRKVSCGDAHCVALSRTGHAYVWGRGRQGQLGLGDVRDAMTPVRVSQKQWCDVAAGQDWSVAVDAHGAVWSWGACGASVLGLSDGDDTDRSAALAELVLHKHVQLRQSQLAGPSESSGSEAPPRFPWLRPQPIPSLSHGDAAIRRVSAGARHAAAISERGDLYVWGSPQQGLTPQPTLVASAHAGIGATIAEQVFCGGSSVVALTSGSFLANAMRRLYDALQSRVTSDSEDLREDLGRPPAGADVVLIVGGGRALFAHKLVLARRSSVLRELILNEERPLEQATESSGAAATPSVTELLLPQLRFEIARVLLEFLYTDNLTTSLDPLAYLIRDVLRAARTFRIPKLVRICRARIESASLLAPSLLAALHDADDQAATSREDEDGDEEDDDEQSAHSLNADLAFAFGDATWSDLRVVAEGRAIPVHTCVLLARSEYFRALLAFHAQQAEVRGTGQRVRELVVEESYAGMLRVLNFIYHDELTTVDRHQAHRDTDDQDPDDSDRAEQLLEDLIAADKYGLVRMKRLCEHHVRVSAGNCLDVLVVADLVRADHLKQVALAFLQRHLDVVNASEGGSVLQRLAREFPHLLTELHGRIQRATQQQTMLREWQRRLDRDARALQERLAQRAQRSSEAAAFPWVPLVLAVAFATLYLSVMNARESDLPLVPAVNVVVVGGLLAAAFFRGGV